MKNILPALLFIFSGLSSYSQPKSNDTLYWSEAEKLQWKDFASKTELKTGEFSQAAFQLNAKFRKGIKVTTSVQVFLDRGKSYAIAEEKTDLMLKYFQTLFDLYEAEARKLRKTLKETKLGWDPEKAFQEKYNASLKELEKRVDLYMEDTETGENSSEVEKWSKMIQQEIKAMEAYKK